MTTPISWFDAQKIKEELWPHLDAFGYSEQDALDEIIIAAEAYMAYIILSLLGEQDNENLRILD